MDLKDVLVVSAPIAPPWNTSNKILTKNILTYVNTVRYQVLTQKGFRFDKPNIVSEDLYQETLDYLPDLQEKIHAMYYLMTTNKDIDLFHFFYKPSKRTSAIFKHLTKFTNRPSIQTVMTYSENYSDIKTLFFANSIVTLSNLTQRKLEGLGVENVQRIYPGVDIKELDQYDPYALEFRKEYGLEQAYLILFAGDYGFPVANKSILESIPPVVSKYPNVKFIFACPNKTESSQKTEAELKKYAIDLGIDKYVLFLGNVEKMHELIRSVDICLFPVSKLDGKMDIPLTLLECMAYGKPVIISDIKPLDEVMIDDVGYKIPPGDIDALVKHILILLESNSHRFEKGFKGRLVVEKHFNMKHIKKEYERLYDSLLSNSSK